MTSLKRRKILEPFFTDNNLFKATFYAWIEYFCRQRDSLQNKSIHKMAFPYPLRPSGKYSNLTTTIDNLNLDHAMKYRSMRDSYLSTCLHFTSVYFTGNVAARINTNMLWQISSDMYTWLSSFRDSFWFRLPSIIRADGRY